jgi:cell wall-associated NlpC family hydrolase
VTADPRVTLARPDLAARALEGLARASRFVDPAPMQVMAPVTALRAGPDGEAEQCDQLLFGEVFDVAKVAGGFAWGQARRDGYVGYVDATALSPETADATHWVKVPRTFAFARATIKSPPFGPLSLNALVTVIEERDSLFHAAGAGWIPKAHLSPVGQALTDPAGVAERFLGAPYLWGGRDSVGIDCSGLAQQAHYACGLACPRDTDQQATLGQDVAPDRLGRGDLVFWRGHVGLMLDAGRLLHANGHHMMVAIEPLARAIARIAAAGAGQPTAFRRL